MHRLLLAAAASAAFLVTATSVDAQPFASPNLATLSGSHIRNGPSAGHVPGGDRHHRRDNRNDVIIGWGWGGEWAYYNNRAFEADSYNDWWHDRPDRAYPHWMQTNRNCDRMWYSADTLRC